MNKGVYVVQNGKLKKVIASGYGDGLVKTVNGIEPDQRGDVDLGEIATPTDVEVAKDNAIKTARGLAKVDMEMATEGIRGFMHRGVWASGVEYEKNNLVIYNESVYQAIKDIKDSDKEVEVEEPEAEVEDNENVVEEVEDTNEPVEPTDEHNPVEINPEDEEFGKMYWRMFAPKTKERPRGTYAEAVNGIVPDETGNIELGQLAMLGDVSDGIDLAVERSGNYTDEQIELIKQEGIGGEVSKQDLIDGVLDAKDHANVVSDRARADANRYTDEEIKKIDLQGLGVPNIIKSIDEPEQPPSANWDIWVQYEKPEGFMTLGELPVGTKINAGLNFDGKNYLLNVADQNAYEQSETLLFLGQDESYLLQSALEEKWEDESITRVDYAQLSIHQWLNSRNEKWFAPMTDWQKKPPKALDGKYGFLRYFPEAVQKHMKTLTLPYTLFPVLDSNGDANRARATFESFNAIAFLPSTSESGDRKDGYKQGYESDKHMVIQGVKNKRHKVRTATRSVRWDVPNQEMFVFTGYALHNYGENIFQDYTVIDPLISFSMDTPVYKVESEDYYAIGGTEQYATPVKQMWVNILK